MSGVLSKNKSALYIEIMGNASNAIQDTMECPLCLGEGHLKRSEVLDRLGVKDFARVAQLSAEEAFRLLLSKNKQDDQNGWARFESELTKRTNLLAERHKDELHLLTTRAKELETAARAAEQQKVHEIQNANRRVEDYLREVANLRERNQELEGEMSKAARRGKVEEISFEEEARTWAGIHISDKLAKNGDFILAYRDAGGAPIKPEILIDCKDKSTLTEADIKKLIRDSKERYISVAVIVAKDETQLRQADRECRWAQAEGIWVLRTTRSWLRRDLDVLRPFLERMRVEGTDFLQKNAAISEEIRRTLIDLDEVEKELKKAAKAIDNATGLTGKYRIRLQTLCDNNGAEERLPKGQPRNGVAYQIEGA